jgi:hypothetical protein
MPNNTELVASTFFLTSLFTGGVAIYRLYQYSNAYSYGNRSINYEDYKTGRDLSELLLMLGCSTLALSLCNKLP